MLTEEFKVKLKGVFPEYENYYTIIKYENARNVFVQDSYGILKCHSCNLRKKYLPSIQASIDKQSYFLNKLYDSNEYYKKGMFEVVSNYINNYTPIIVKNKYGCCSLTADNLFRGSYPTNETAIDKTLFFLKRLQAERPEMYSRWDYSNFTYIKNDIKSEVICGIHGTFYTTPNKLLYGRAGCKKCGNIKVQENPTGWTYYNWQKASEKSKFFDSFKVYVIRCWDENEEFYKIGKTFCTIAFRFGKGDNYKMPYNYEVIKIFESKDDGCSISKLEKKLQKLNKKNKYKPLKYFKGLCECFKQVDYEL